MMFNKCKLCLAGILALAVLFFGFVIVRVGIAKPATKFEVAKIPEELKLTKIL